MGAPFSNRREGGPTVAVGIFSVEGDVASAQSDQLAVEEPLEIRLRSAEQALEEAAATISLTMRTPGSSVDEDAELALGFLFSEGLLRTAVEVAAVTHPEDNVVEVVLRATERPAWRPLGLARHFYTTSACGVCGKSALDALTATPALPLRPADARPRLPPSILHQLPSKLRAAQAAFASTGGLHAAGPFDGGGHLLLAREDVGRHNAVDKLLGAGLLAAIRDGDSGVHPPTRPDAILVVSGRASFELVQKARMAAIPILVAIGAPSSLALTLAREAGMTLIGFARDGRCNVYCAPERLALRPRTAAPHAV